MIRYILRKYFHLPVLYKDEIALTFRDKLIPTIYLPKMESYNSTYQFAIALGIILKGSTPEHLKIINDIEIEAIKIFKWEKEPK